MKGFSIYYINAIAACILLFLVLLIFNRRNLDRQEKQVKFDLALIAFILYFIADCFWAAIADGLIPRERLYVVINDFAIFVLMAAICYFWLDYVMAVVQAPERNKRATRLTMLIPLLVSAGALVINYLIAPLALIDKELNATGLYDNYLIFTQTAYLVAVLFYTLKKARQEENPEEQRKLIFIGMLPLCTVISGIIQQAFPYIPIYCFIDALVIIIFYIQSIDARVSVDALTNLNNRGALMRYASVSSNLHQESRLTVVIMMDIDKFKSINDTYGHAEGDRALIIVADSLKSVVRTLSMPSFIGRYGGDEFVLIIHPETGTDIDDLMDVIRGIIKKELDSHETQYDLSMSIGYDELKDDEDSIQDCMKRADENLYQDKKHQKL